MYTSKTFACHRFVDDVVLVVQNSMYIDIQCTYLTNFDVEQYCIVTHTAKYDQIQSVFLSLHWLPLPSRGRTQHNILLLVFNCIHSTGLAYHQLVKLQLPTHSSRSAEFSYADSLHIYYIKSCFLQEDVCNQI